MFVQHRFHLDHMVEDRLRSLIPPFGYNGFGEFIFYRTYSRTKQDRGQEDWADVVIRNTNGTFSIRKDWYIKNHIAWDEQFWQSYAAGFAESMFHMRWMPPGRGMWAMGSDFVYERGSMALYNCFRGTTQFLTSVGLSTFEDADGEKVHVKCADGKFRSADVRSFGKQKLNRVVFKPHCIGNNHHMGRTSLRLTYDVTPNHRWVLSDNSVTTILQMGDKVKAKCSREEIDFDSQEYVDGFAHGIIFGDGSKDSDSENRFRLRLCSDPNNESLAKLVNSTYYVSRTQPPSYGGDWNLTFRCFDNLKEVPEGKCLSHLRGFFDGWVEADGWDKSIGKSVMLDSQDSAAIDWAISIASLVGYLPTGRTADCRDTNYGPRKSPLNRLSLVEDDVTYVVESVVSLGIEEEVYCVVEPVTETFTLAGGVPTKNCAYTDLTTRFLSDDIAWLMDSLMHGVGVGFGPLRDGELRLYEPVGTYDHVIADSREGWVESERALIDAYTKPGQRKPRMIYDLVREAGLVIKGFGGISSGPGPLRELHERTEREMEMYLTRPEYDIVYLKTNLANHTGCCVVAGNVRRSAELGKGKVHDKTFMNLKDYKLYPEREAFGWMSNNSVELETDEDFMMLGEIARRVIANGEPGYINRRNMPYGRIGKKMKGLRWDAAVGFNPCGEIPLEHREVERMPRSRGNAA